LAITFLMCVVYIRTFWQDVKYPQQVIVRELPLKILNLILDLNYFSFSNPNPNPTAVTYKHQVPSPNNQFSQCI